MADKETLTIAIMDAPYKSARSSTALRLIDAAVRRSYDVNFFAYEEGEVSVPFALQKPHANAVHGREVEEENHPLPKDWVTALVKEAAKNGAGRYRKGHASHHHGHASARSPRRLRDGRVTAG